MMGFIKVFTGPMFSGKTTRLIEEANTYAIRGYTLKIYAPRLTGVEIKSRNGGSLSCKSLDTSSDFYHLRDEFLVDCIPSSTLVVIEEAQFFGKQLAAAVQSATLQGVSFLISGLARDFMGRPFGDFPLLLCYADEIISLKAVCCTCKRHNATRTIRTTNDTETIIIGSDLYAAICPSCQGAKQ